MSESEFLESYDPSDYERPSVTVDLVLLTVVEGQLAVLLQQRREHPFKDCWALPGGFVGIDEDLDEAASRVRSAKAHLDMGYLEQLYTFGSLNRDPRTRVISVAYISLMPMLYFSPALKHADGLVLAELNVPWEGETGGPVMACSEDGTELPLAFDHAEILGQAVKRLRGKLDYTPIGFALLDELFTLRELQGVHEAVLGTRFHKPAFRRRILDKGWIEGTGERETGASFRPAELYKLKN
ncbi:8-oxo-dGTP diphosphatase [Sphingobium sp. B7D2B]|uniref:NUDIX hydrolase n=1 Tax=Sphingobium sp. B7D2B TaxID=2940583 RepID=UPI002225A8E0|nr:NUDIX domain-containing protein [Sphingobium sp. B7D2B]MCW2364828.1 8-oxo-dGTP diphosphatase [Sphingobium sp. B7D2B]